MPLKSFWRLPWDTPSYISLAKLLPDVAFSQKGVWAMSPHPRGRAPAPSQRLRHTGEEGQVLEHRGCLPASLPLSIPSGLAQRLWAPPKLISDDLTPESLLRGENRQALGT